LLRRFRALRWRQSAIHPFLSLSADHADVDTSLITAMLGAQTGMMQLAVAARFVRMNADQGASIAKLIDAAQQNASSLANVADNVGTNLDVSA
jgi:hypothetical protein